MDTNFARQAIDAGGILRPMIIPSHLTQGLGLMNPSVIYEEGKIKVIIRNVNYTFYHSEKKLFQHPYGPLTYIHPENDIHLRTWNWYCELDDNLNLIRYSKIDTSKFDTYEPKWDFVGLEDARIFRWNDKLYTSGVRRDTTPNGEGRMELCGIEVSEDKVTEVSRVRIEPPNDPNSYCEKNWMPITDKPFHYVKWSNPTEVVEINPISGQSTTTHLSEYINIGRDLRGGSQVIPHPEGYIAVTHEVDLFNSEEGRKDAVYYHRFVIWDKNFNLIKVTKEFHFMDAQVEFCIGMTEYENEYLLTFGFQDNAAFILKVSQEFVNTYINHNLI